MKLTGRGWAVVWCLVIVFLSLLYLASCAGNPKPPVPLPTPTPPPTPVPVVVCPLHLPLVGYGMGLRIEQRLASPQQHDATPFIKKGNDPTMPWPPLGWTGACRTIQCDLSAEKDPEHGDVCTRTLCGETIKYELEPPESGLVNWVQGYSVKTTMKENGRLVGTCSANTAVSSSVLVP